MSEIFQGDIIKIEGEDFMALVVSKGFFNGNEQVVACPILKKAKNDPLHIYFQAEKIDGYTLCEQLRFFDLRKRYYKVCDRLNVRDVIEITDAIQSIFDYFK